jgi:hypothetical protein
MFGRPPNYLAESSVPKAIHLLNLRTREVSTLPGSDGLFAPRWSPSGRYVAALTLNAKTLLLFDFRTRTWTELGRFKTVHNPVWSREERFLYFQVVEEVGIYRVRLSDRAVERVAGLEAGRLSKVWPWTILLSSRAAGTTATSTRSNWKRGDLKRRDRRLQPSSRREGNVAIQPHVAPRCVSSNSPGEYKRSRRRSRFSLRM